jgi:protein-S-isoprenylcysteine O-methyltransferase Ste14
MALLRQAWRLLVLTAAYGAALFGAAGTWRWPAAWAFIAVTVALTTAYVLVVARSHPDLAQERVAPPPDAKRWDRPLVVVLGIVGPLVTAVTAGLDERFEWSGGVSTPVQAASLLAIAASGGFTCWAVSANRFFSAVVRIQRDRGHRVVESGPYKVVRHPGYAASLLHMIATPLALDAAWAFLPVSVLAVILILRTRLEDEALQKELEGYTAYAGRVRYRLIPAIW